MQNPTHDITSHPSGWLLSKTKTTTKKQQQENKKFGEDVKKLEP